MAGMAQTGKKKFCFHCDHSVKTEIISQHIQQLQTFNFETSNNYDGGSGERIEKCLISTNFLRLTFSISI